jgi:cold shock CspA family protein
VNGPIPKESVMNAPVKLRGRVRRLQPARNRSFFGFIQGEDGRKYFFHSDDVLDDYKTQIRSGSPVAFNLGVSVEKGQYKRAADVEVLQLKAAA